MLQVSYMEVILDKMVDYTDHVDGGTSRFDQNGVIYQAVCANCGGGAVFPTTPGAWATAKPASANCNLGMIKISFNLAGVGSHVSSAIRGCTKRYGRVFST